MKSSEIRKMIQDMNKEGNAKFNVDEFIELATPRMATRDSKEEIMKIFDLFDEDGSGKITFHKLKRVAKELGEPYLDDEEAKSYRGRQIVMNNDGAIDRDEFLRVMKKRGDNPLDDLDSDSN